MQAIPLQMDMFHLPAMVIIDHNRLINPCSGKETTTAMLPADESFSRPMGMIQPQQQLQYNNVLLFT
jgi:hypothetical protein